MLHASCWCALLLLLPAAAAAPGSAHGVTWLVQLSDVHVSSFYPSREADLRSFASSLLPLLRPAALLLTGDLTDAKSRSGRAGAQNASEWSTYGELREVLLASSRLPRSSLLQLRGNHDTFDVVARGGDDDLFATSSASPSDAAPRVRAITVGDRPPVRLLSIDVSRSPGLRRPCNFAGLASAGVLSSVRGALASPRPHGEATLAMAHFPLTLIEHGRALGEALAKGGASALVDGHLHWRFGRKLHVRHSFGGGGGNTSLLELEAGDWKDARAWRLVAFDAARDAAGRPTLSFRDFVFSSGDTVLHRGARPLLITYPGDARHAPDVSGTTAEQPTAERGTPADDDNAVRALFFGPGNSLAAEATCGGEAVWSALLRRDSASSPVFYTQPPARRQPSSSTTLRDQAGACLRRTGAPLLLRVFEDGSGGGTPPSSHNNSAAFASDARPVRFDGGIEPTGAPAVTRAALRSDGPALAKAALFCVCSAHVLLLAAAPPPLRRRPRLRAALLAHAAYLAVLPWAGAKLLSRQTAMAGLGWVLATGFLLEPTVFPMIDPTTSLSNASAAAVEARRPNTRLEFHRNADAIFLTGPQSVLNLAWLCLLLACLMLRDARRLRGVAFAAAAFTASVLVAAQVLIAAEMRESYGWESVPLGFGFSWTPLLFGLAYVSGCVADGAPKARGRKPHAS